MVKISEVLWILVDKIVHNGNTLSDYDVLVFDGGDHSQWVYFQEELCLWLSWDQIGQVNDNFVVRDLSNIEESLYSSSGLTGNIPVQDYLLGHSFHWIYYYLNFAEDL